MSYHIQHMAVFTVEPHNPFKFPLGDASGGLGVKRLVSLMQGNMWVESEVSKGSKFFFTITSQISHSSMESTLGKMAAFAKRTILFVDTLFDRTGVAIKQREWWIGSRIWG
jgi:osomolarity two-component system, sensor histidine kinase NIK1